jgi:hypothetical protein
MTTGGSTPPIPTLTPGVKGGKPALDDPRRCQATNKKTGQPCANWAIKGATTCRFHGSAAPQVRAQAAARVLMATYGQPVDVDPLGAIFDELRRTAGHVAWLGLEVARLPTPLTSGPFGTTIVDPMVKLYQSERAHLAKVSADCLKAGVDERRVRLAEAQGELVADLLRRVITALGLDPASEEVRTVVRRELLQLVPG